MERRTTGGGGRRIEKESKAGPFFVATLVMWCVSVFFEILFNSRYELFPILVGIVFFQSANYAFRNFLSRDPVFVNTCVSLLHSSITSAFEYLSPDGVLIKAIKDLLSEDVFLGFKHTSRQSNSAAHKLAQFAFSSPNPCTWCFIDFPSWLQDIVTLDSVI